jgi:hypothetical protein
VRSSTLQAAWALAALLAASLAGADEPRLEPGAEPGNSPGPDASHVVASIPDHRFFAGLGMLVFNGGRYANQASGDTGYGALVLPELSVSARIPLGTTSWRIAPLLSFTPIAHKSVDGGESTYVLRYEVKAVRELFWGLDAEAGVGIYDAIIRGTGGTIELGNGNSKSTFGFPSHSSSTLLFYWEAGLGHELIHSLRVDAQAFVTNLVSSGRTFNYSLQLSYGWL